MANIKLTVLVISVALIVAFIGSSKAIANGLKLNIAYLKLAESTTNKEGFDGLMLAVNESNIAGKFLQQQFDLSYFETDKTAKLQQQVQQYYRSGVRFFIINSNEAVLQQLNLWASNKDVLLFNINESSDRLRSDDCLASVLHTLPSEMMKTDAIAQWLIKKNLRNIQVLNAQTNSANELLIAFNRSAQRFDLNLTAPDEQPDAIFVSSGKQLSKLKNQDKLMALPAIGVAGITAHSWHSGIKKWGAIQLHSRFRKLAGRAMNQVDFGGYLAGLTISQAFFHVKSTESARLIDFIKSPKLVLAAYVGHPLSYRPWSGQLRMPIALIRSNKMISQSPQRGIKHHQNILDSLGVDRSQSNCIKVNKSRSVR